MATKIKTWQIVDGRLEAVESTLVEEGRTEAYDLEEWIVSNPSIIGPDILVIGRQVTTRPGPLDLLAVDKDGNLVVIELKRDQLPREALAQAIDYASDVADWDIDKINGVCLAHTEERLEDALNARFPDINLESINVNETQRVILIGFSIEPSLERMIEWLSSNYSVNINAILLNYIKTKSGEELLTRTSIISEQVEQERIRKRKFQIPMSDEPGEYDEAELKRLLKNYLSLDLYSARRIRDVLLPVCLKREVVPRDELKEEFVNYGEADDIRRAGHFLSLISQQIGIEKNDFLRQVIGYEYPTNPWEKDNYRVRDEYKELVAEVLSELD
jgi:RecB family endonuclease NucS